MPALRTSLVILAVGGAAVTTGVGATSATAAPTPVRAVAAAAPAGTAAPADGPAVRGKVRAWWSGLTDTQQQCLEDAGIRRPVGPLDDAQRATLRSQVEKAAATCGVELPFARARAFWDGLSDTQQQCLKAADVTRPWGPLTKEQRQQVRKDLAAAASACGVTLPAKPAASAAPTAPTS
jgi:hypothetical protein